MLKVNMPMMEQKCINIPQKLLQRVKADKHSLELLALSAIRTMDKCPIGFDSPLMKFYGALAGKDVN